MSEVPTRLAVAYSGGRDSTALLHATLHAVSGQGIEVVALHVNHGLHPQAASWERHCRETCARWAAAGLAVTFACARLRSKPLAGDSVEDWARRERYAALARLARRHHAAVVLLAHHRRDQAETFILQALRSAGVAGMAGMPQAVERDGVTWMRPWLAQSFDAIDRYVQSQQLIHIEDDSNQDPRYARNRLRHDVWPLLVRAFPEVDTALATAAGWAQQAQACLDDVARDDLAALVHADHIDLNKLRCLSAPRRVNALRAWLKRQTGVPAPATLVTRLVDELPGEAPATWPVPGGCLRRYRGRLVWEAVSASEWRPAVDRVTEAVLCVRRAGLYRLPGWGGGLRVTRVREGGVPLAWLAHLELRERQGGEQFQSGLGRPPRSLKKQFQAAGCPAWQRTGPLVYSGQQLIYVPGLGLDARVIGLPGQAQATLSWESADSS